MSEKAMKEHEEYLAWTYFSEDAYDQREFTRLRSLLHSTRLFIDVGASHGVYTFHVNRLIQDAAIVAIEADPSRFALLKDNVQQWSGTSTNAIACVHAAASDEADRRQAESASFYVTGSQISGGLFAVPERSDDYRPTAVPLVTLDDYYRPGVPTLVKIDVEGAELRVLKGATKHIESGHTTFLTEIAWFGDRQRRTGTLDVLLFAFRRGMRVERHTRSNYLLSYEPNALKRALSALQCLPPLVARYAWNRLVPLSVRKARERRLTAERFARYHAKRQARP
ncbi:MAG: FkbM family methyltransferase [Acidobacteriota bacterium]|nr:FkbM family methyltransferase [Acidobacteriota bacterium]